MVSKIEWSDEAVLSYISIIEYLEKEWSDKEIKDFVAKATNKIELLRTFPKLGRIVNKRNKLFRTVLHKNVILIYQYHPYRKEIILVNFWQTRQKLPRKYE